MFGLSLIYLAKSSGMIGLRLLNDSLLISVIAQSWRWSTILSELWADTSLCTVSSWINVGVRVGVSAILVIVGELSDIEIGIDLFRIEDPSDSSSRTGENLTGTLSFSWESSLFSLIARLPIYWVKILPLVD